MGQRGRGLRHQARARVGDRVSKPIADPRTGELEDFPALFAAPAAKPPRVDAAERAAAPGGRKLSSAERIAQQVLQA